MMRRIALFVLCWSLLLLPACQKKIPQGPEYEAEKQINAALAKGETLIDFKAVPESEAKLGKIIGLVDAPIDQVWKAVADLPNYKDFMPFFAESRIRKVEGNTVYFYSLITTSIPLSPEIWTVQEINFHPDEYYADFRMVEGNLAKTYGSWKLEPFALDPRKTRITYEALMDPGSKFLSAMADFTASTLMPMIVSRLKDRVAEHHYEMELCPPYARTTKMKEEMKGLLENDKLGTVM